MSDKIVTVLQIITSPVGGGAEVLARKLGAKLVEYGFRSELLYFNMNSNISSHLQLRPNEKFLHVSSRNPLAITKLRKFIKAVRYKSNELVIHVHLTWPFYYVTLSCLGLDVKLIYTEHNTFNRRRKIPFLKIIERFFYSRYSKIICVSNGVRHSLCDWIGVRLCQRTLVVTNGASIYKFAKRNSKLEIIRFVSIGSLTSKKGFKTALTALSILKGYNWRYTIIGDGPDHSNLQALASRLKISDRVNFIGWSDEVEMHLHQADIQLIPSLWEGFGLVAVEGMSTGLPVVASHVDGLREVLDPGNPATFLVEDFSNEDAWLKLIVECIESLRNNREHISRAARKQAEKFSFEKMVADYIEVYRDIVDEPKDIVNTVASL